MINDKRTTLSRSLAAPGICLSLILNGCTQTAAEQQIEAWGLQDYVQVMKPTALHEALLAHTFTERGFGNYQNNVAHETQNFSAQEETLVQNALTRAVKDQSTVWNNPRYGELTLILGQHYQQEGQACRAFVVSHLQTATFMTRQKYLGDACFNPASQTWEWAGAHD